MDFKLSCASILPWIWVIETLGSSDEVDISLLLDLVEKTQGIFDGPGRNSRELVSLRILEIVSVKGGSVPPESYAGQKFELDPSESCEDVLRRMVLETSSLNLKTTRMDMLKKWNLVPFIAQKRANFTKFSLQRLKDAISAGSYPIDEHLMKQSDLSVEDQPEHRVSTIGCYSDIAPKVVGRDEHAQCSENVPLSSPSLNNDNSLLHKHPLSKTSAKRGILCATFEDEITRKNDCDGHLKVAKRYKHGNTCSRNFTSTDSGSQLAGEPKKIVQDTEAHRLSLEKRNLVGYTGTNELSTSGTDHCTLSNEIFGHNEVLSLETQIPLCDILVVSNNSDSKQGQNHDSGHTRFNKDEVLYLQTTCESMERFEGNIQRETFNVSNAECEVEDGGDKKNISGRRNTHENMNTIEESQETVPIQALNVGESGKGLNISSNSDSADERTNCATQQNPFLISQSAYSQDSLSAADLSEVKCCLKCGSEGELLMCSSNACPFTVHEICLGSAVSFDRMGRFSCPSCAYSQAIKQYEEAKEKTSSARKHLANFLCFRTSEHANEVIARDLMKVSKIHQNKKN